jgi:hypothetical protein
MRPSLHRTSWSNVHEVWRYADGRACRSTVHLLKCVPLTILDENMLERAWLHFSLTRRAHRFVQVSGRFVWFRRYLCSSDFFTPWVVYVSIVTCTTLTDLKEGKMTKKNWCIWYSVIVLCMTKLIGFMTTAVSVIISRRGVLNWWMNVINAKWAWNGSM